MAAERVAGSYRDRKGYVFSSGDRILRSVGGEAVEVQRDFLASPVFDRLVSGDVIEHILDTDTFLEKAHSLLTEDGYFYLQTPNLASWHGRLSLLFGYTPEAMEVSMVKNFFGKFWIFRHENDGIWKKYG